MGFTLQKQILFIISRDPFVPVYLTIKLLGIDYPLVYHKHPSLGNPTPRCKTGHGYIMTVEFLSFFRLNLQLVLFTDFAEVEFLDLSTRPTLSSLSLTGHFVSLYRPLFFISSSSVDHQILNQDQMSTQNKPRVLQFFSLL